MINIKELQSIPCDTCIHNKVCTVRKQFEETTINTTHPYVIVKLECTEFLANNGTIKTFNDCEQNYLQSAT